METGSYGVPGDGTGSGNLFSTYDGGNSSANGDNSPNAEDNLLRRLSIIQTCNEQCIKVCSEGATAGTQGKASWNQRLAVRIFFVDLVDNLLKTSPKKDLLRVAMQLHGCGQNLLKQDRQNGDIAMMNRTRELFNEYLVDYGNKRGDYSLIMISEIREDTGSYQQRSNRRSRGSGWGGGNWSPQQHIHGGGTGYIADTMNLNLGNVRTGEAGVSLSPNEKQRVLSRQQREQVEKYVEKSYKCISKPVIAAVNDCGDVGKSIIKYNDWNDHFKPVLALLGNAEVS